MPTISRLAFNTMGIESLSLYGRQRQNQSAYIFIRMPTKTPNRIIPMTLDAATGIWTASDGMEWNRLYYLFEVEVYVRQENRVVRNVVTDPYSLNLSQNSRRSQIVNLDNEDLFPEDWQSLTKPPLESIADIVIYELHLRDFSIQDNTVPESLRGTYLAFTESDSDGMTHLSNCGSRDDPCPPVAPFRYCYDR